MRITENSYQNLMSPHNIALLSDWLTESGELVVYVDRPHRGGDHDQYTIESLADLKSILAAETWPELHVTVFRGKHYPIRGSVDEGFISRALHEIPDGTAYAIVRIGRYPAPYEYYNEGRSQAELSAQLSGLSGSEVALGQDPMAQDEVAGRQRHERRFDLFVSKNQNFYRPLADNPARYENILSTWYSS